MKLLFLFVALTLVGCQKITYPPLHLVCMDDDPEQHLFRQLRTTLLIHGIQFTPESRYTLKIEVQPIQRVPLAYQYGYDEEGLPISELVVVESRLQMNCMVSLLDGATPLIGPLLLSVDSEVDHQPEEIKAPNLNVSLAQFQTLSEAMTRNKVVLAHKMATAIKNLVLLRYSLLNQ